jgi:hypothetical protein
VNVEVNAEIIPDIPRLYTALAEWAACLVYIAAGKKRVSQPRLVVVLALALAVQILWHHIAGTLPVLLWIPGMVLAAALMYLVILLCCETSPLRAGYRCIRAFILAEFAASFLWQLCFYLARNTGSQYPWLDPVLLAVIYAAVFGGVYRMERRYTGRDAHISIHWHELWPALAIGVSVFALSNLSFVRVDTPFSSRFVSEIFNIRTLVDLCGIVILHAYHVQISELYLKFELDAIQHIFQSQYEQYKISRDSIELINRRYHDLKHQIAALRAENNSEKRLSYLADMENEIKRHEALNKTGHAVLDTVLTGKSLYCVKHGIDMTCVADGALLGFLDVMDLCTIFGNALDNAIESVMRITEQEKRLIHIAVFSRNGMIMMRFENYYEGAVLFDGGEGGLPITTKTDTAFHGYGLKSIRYSAEKYGGYVTVKTANNWFELNVLFPGALETSRQNDTIEEQEST